MQYGGMPLAVLKSDEERKEYLKSLFATTYFADIVERNQLKKRKDNYGFNKKSCRRRKWTFCMWSI